MMPYKVMAVLCAGLISNTALSCSLLIDGLATENLNFQEAQNKLTNILFSTADESSIAGLEGQALVDQIDCYLASQEIGLKQLSSVRSPLRKRGSSLFNARSDIERSMVLEGINSTVNRDAGTGYVVLPNHTGGRTEISLYDDVLAGRCATEASKECTAGLNTAKTLWWIAGQYRGFASQFNQQAIQQSLRFNDTLDKQWRSYKDDTIKLWPQEILLNSVVYKPSNRGLSAPPSYKLLALRPSLGLSYLSDQSHHIQPTINIDLLGIYWWRYQDHKATPGRGVSASLVWDGDDTAYGLSYHHSPKWTATVAQGDENDIVLSVSFQLAYWFLKR